MRPVRRPILLLASIVAFALVGCGAQQDEPQEEATGAADEPADPDGSMQGVETELPEACERTQGIDDDTIRLGMFTDLSGPLADIGGAAIAPVLEAYFAEVNEAGGVAGRRVELDIRDMRFNPVDAATQYEAIRGTVAMVPLMFMPDAVAALAEDLAEDCLLTFIGPQNGQLPQAHEMVFAPSTAGSHELINAIAWVLEHEDGAADATWALAHATDGSGEELADGAQHAADWFDLEFAETVTFAGTDQDLTAQAQALLAAEADYVVVGGVAPQLGALVAAVVGGGGDMTFLTYTSGSPQALLAGPAGPLVAEHTLLSSSYNAWVDDAPGLERLDAVIAGTDVPDPLRRSMQVLTAWYTAALAHATLEAAADAGDLSLGGLYRAASTLEFDPEGIAPEGRYGQFDDAPRLATKSSRMLRVDPQAPAGLTEITDWFVSDAAAAYTPPS